jgi:dephospho-CoA kinase
MLKTGNVTVIGLTAPFGSGCTTTAEILKAKLNFHIVRLSDVVRKEWTAKNPGRNATRADLQTLGNQIRKSAQNPGELARLALESVTDGSILKLAVDGIRNVGEVEFLRETFGRKFYLVALECPQSERYERLEQADLYADIDRFREDNERDRNERTDMDSR